MILSVRKEEPWNWADYVDLQMMADDFKMIIISLGSGSDPWENPYKGKYIDYVLEIVNIVDQSFNTITDKEHRAICGRSMGGDGALKIASEHKNVFGSVSSMSGRYVVQSDADYERLRGLSIFFDCGLGDPVIAHNNELHEKLSASEIGHLYFTFAGEHNWEYWDAHNLNHFIFHSDYFKSH